ncbi:MAG: ATP-dependent zinc metalloprotease FtsH [Clostridia bacterium]
MNEKKSPFKNPLIAMLVISVGLTVLLNVFISFAASQPKKEITYNEFMTMLDNNRVDEVVLKTDRLIIYENVDENSEEVKNVEAAGRMAGNLSARIFGRNTDSTDIIENAKKEMRKVYYTGYINDDRLLEKLDEKGVTYGRSLENSSGMLEFFLWNIMPFLLIFALMMFFSRSLSKKMGGGGIMGIGQSNAKMYNIENKTGVTFADVAGQEEAKESLDEIVDFLHNPTKYTAIGAKQPKGALLVGPPGTGKTLLAKAVAGEANVPFFSLSGSEFVEMFVGVGASRVRDLFKQASAKAPCIIFIDEIDAIGKSRDNQLSSNDEREQTLNQLLSEMDGFDSSKGLVILAATNRPEVLDKALLRPGRFDRRIIVEKPDLKGREDILKVHIKNVKTDPSIDLHAMALATSGAVGADLANMVNEAALRAVRMGRKLVLQEDLMEAVEVIIAGKEKKDRILSENEKRIVAFHEVGHALATALQKNTQPVHKITIVPRTMGALGYTMQMPEEEEKYLMSKDEILDQLTVFLAGRAAEEIVFNTKTTGASNDIERATALARNMITQYGMSDKFGMAGLESVQNKYLDGRSVSNCSEETKTAVDNEVVSVLKNCYDKALLLLNENREALDEIAEFLIDKETITGDQFMEIFNKVNERHNVQEAAEQAEENAND